MIGAFPHKLSATIEIVDHREQLLGSGRRLTIPALIEGCVATPAGGETSVPAASPGRGPR